MRVDGEHALLPLLREIGLQLRPDRLGALRRAGEEVFVAGVGRDVADDEIAHVDRGLPGTRRKPLQLSALSCSILSAAPDFMVDLLSACVLGHLILRSASAPLLI